MPETAAAARDPEAAGLYRDTVMERARRPLLAGVVEAADGTGEGANPLCGDRTRVTLRRDGNGRAVAVRHETRGCAICAASADLMAERAAGLDRTETEALVRRFERLVDGEEPDGGAGAGGTGGLGPLEVFGELRAYASRRKCAMLPFSALLAAHGAEEDR